jgi:hypothetical protein
MMENKKFEVQIKLIILSRNPHDSFRHNVALNKEDKLFSFFVANDKTLSRSLSDGNWTPMESLKNEQYFPLLIDAARRLSYEVV